MTPKLLIYPILLVSIFSCSQSQTKDQTKTETPKALEDNNSSFDLVSKRGPENLVESLYNELAKKDAELMKLEATMASLAKSKDDSTGMFISFNSKNQSYFNSAEQHVTEIKDSILRGKIKNLLSDQLLKYNSQIGNHSKLLESIERNQISISDLYTALKVVKTLPLIDKYQKDNLPDTKPLEGYKKLQEGPIKLLDTLVRN